MTLRKMGLLSAMALAALAFAIPASASAGMFLHEGAPIAAGGETETFEGTVEFTGGVHCENAVAEVHITTNSASVESFEAEGCNTIETIKAVGCNLTSETAPLATFAGPNTGEGWPVDVGATSFTITSPVIDNPMAAGCMFGANIKVTGGEVIATPTNSEEIGEVGLSGTVTTTIGNAAVHGTLFAAVPGTYGLE
jgi:hypothetical protein